MVRVKSKFNFIFLSILLISSFSFKINAAEDRISNGLNVMEYFFDKYPENSYLVKYRKDGRFIGVLVTDNNNIGHLLQVFDVFTGEKVFEYTKKDKEIVNFKFKKNAVILFYKSALWEEKMAYDLYSGRVVRRYSSWLGYK
ncbi:hypothetical protein ACFLYU_03115 [Candidatus Dependentiae bacterium]